MKHVPVKFLYLMLLFLVACTAGQEPRPTPVPLGQNTDTPLPTPSVSPTFFNTPMPTATATLTPTPTATFPPRPTSTPEPTATPPPPTATPPPGTAFTEGIIAVLWNPDYGQTRRIVTYQLDFAIPGPSPEEWVIQTALTGLTSQYMFPAPDGRKLALAQYKDTNEDGYIPSRQGGDSYDIYLYTIADGSLTRLTDNQFPHYPEVGWLPDSQSFTYPIRHDIWLVELNSSSQQLLLDDLDNRVFGHVWSPNGALLAINTQGVNEPSPPELDKLSIYDAATDDLIHIFDNMPVTLDVKWSADSNWLTVAPRQIGGLYLINSQTLEVTEIIPPDTGIILPEWASNSQFLAFIEDFSALRLLDIATGILTELAHSVHDTQFRAFTWSPDSSELAVTIWEEEQVSVAIIDRENGSIHTLFTIDRVDRGQRPEGFEVIDELQLLTWSPDGKWLLFFAEQDNEVGLYVINREGGMAYLILETGLYTFFHQSFSNNEIDRTRHVVWLPNPLRQP